MVAKLLGPKVGRQAVMLHSSRVVAAITLRLLRRDFKAACTVSRIRHRNGYAKKVIISVHPSEYLVVYNYCPVVPVVAQTHFRIGLEIFGC